MSVKIRQPMNELYHESHRESQPALNNVIVNVRSVRLSTPSNANLVESLKDPYLMARLPDAFEDIVGEVIDMKANKTKLRHNAGNLEKRIFQRFPNQPEYHAFNPALEFFRDELHKILHEHVSNALVTDAAFLRYEHRLAVLRDEDWRVFMRRMVECGFAKQFAIEWINGELRRRQEFFAKVFRTIVTRTHRMALARRLELERRERAEKHRWQVTRTWEENRNHLIQRRFSEDEKDWHWRLANLFFATENGVIGRLQKRGHPIEEVFGKIFGKKRHAITEALNKWRRDLRFVTLPNGGLIRTPTGAGQAKEHVLDVIFQPVRDQRSQNVRHWHQTRFQVTTPNHGMIAAPELQGQIPEMIAEIINKPIQDGREQRHKEFLKSDNFVTLPNSGLIHSKANGKTDVRLRGELYWPKREKVSFHTEIWHQEHMFAQLPNGGYAPLRRHGQSLEHLVAVKGEQQNHKAKSLSDKAGNHHQFVAMGNGSVGNLDGSKHSIEKVSGDIGEKKADLRSSHHRLWHETYKFNITANQGFAPSGKLGKQGHTIEDTVGKLGKQHIMQDIAYFNQKQDQQIAQDTMSRPDPDDDRNDKDDKDDKSSERSETSDSDPRSSRSSSQEPHKNSQKQRAIKAFEKSMATDATTQSSRFLGQIEEVIEVAWPAGHPLAPKK